MKNELIHALKAVQPRIHDQASMSHVIYAIEAKSCHIPTTDYETMARFIFHLLNEFPEIMQARPDDKPLKDLGLFVLQQLVLLERKDQGPHL